VIAKVVMLSMLLLLASCGGHAVRVQNPETGEIVQCENEPRWFETESWLFRTVGQTLANDRCAGGYERQGWRRLN
jgi:hypothetical protein